MSNNSLHASNPDKEKDNTNGYYPSFEVDVEVGERVTQASRRRTTSDLRTAFSILKVYIGVGVLGLPAEFGKTGLAGSLVAMVILSVVSLHTLVLLVQSKDRLVERGQEVTTFGDVSTKALGRAGRVSKITIDVLLVFTQVGFCCTYLIFLGKSTVSLFESIPLQLAICFWTIIVMALSLIRTLKSLGPLAAIATILLGSAMLMILVAAIQSWVENVKFDSNADVKWFDYTQLPTMIGVAIFSFEGIGFVLPAQTAIKRQSHFLPLLTVSLIVISSMYIFFGTFGYLGFRENVKEQILDCFFAMSGDAWLIVRKVVTVLLVLSISVTYPMQLFVATDILEEKLFDHSINTRKKWWIESIFRVCLVLFTSIVAISVPFVNSVMSLVGSLGSAPLQYIFPSLIYLRVFRDEIGIPMRCLLFLYVIGGIVAMVGGTYQSIAAIIHSV